MLCKNIIEIIEATYPKNMALEWDNVGLLVGRTEKEVEKIYVALDATDEVIDAAAAWGADMLVTHHPMIFSALKKITDEDFIAKRVVKLLQNDISYYAMHTNYDVLGMADLSGEILGLQESKVLEVTTSPEDGAEPLGIGKVGTFAETITVRECCERVKQAFVLPNVKVFGDLDGKVNRVAISPGSGKHMTAFALEKDAEVLITGDIDHHEGIDAVSQGLVVIDAGHYGLEHIFIRDIAGYLEKKLEGVQVECAEMKHPFQVI